MNIRGILRRASAMLLAVLTVISSTPVGVYYAAGTATLTLNVDIDKFAVVVTDANGIVAADADSVEGIVSYSALPAGVEYVVSVTPIDSLAHAVYAVIDENDATATGEIADGVYTENITPGDGATLTRTVTAETFYNYTVNMDTTKGSVGVSDGVDEVTPVSSENNVITYKLSDKKNYTFIYVALENERFDTFNGTSLNGVETYTENIVGDELEANAVAGTNAATLKFYSEVDCTIRVNLPAAHVSMDGLTGVEDGSGNIVFTVKKGSTPTLNIDPLGHVFKSIIIGENE